MSAQTNAGGSDKGPDLSAISNAIVNWMDEACKPVQVFFRVPFRMRFRSDLAAPADRVWAHAASMQGVNTELGPWLRMNFPASAPLPAEIAQRRAGAGGSSVVDAQTASFDPANTSLDTLLAWGGQEEVEGLQTMGPVEHACTATLLWMGVLPIDRHAMGFESIWREKHAEAAADDSDVVAGFDEVSTSVLHREWTHSRAVTHVSASAVTPSSSKKQQQEAARAYTRVTDEVAVTPRSFLFLLYPFIFLLVWLTFRWRHHRLRALFGTYNGPKLATETTGGSLKTKSHSGFATLTKRTKEEMEEEEKDRVIFVKAQDLMQQQRQQKANADAEADSAEGDEFELVDVDAPEGGASAKASSSRKKK